MKLSKKENSKIKDYEKILDKAKKSGLTIEVIYTAFKIMEETSNISSLLALQIASEDWDC